MKIIYRSKYIGVLLFFVTLLMVLMPPAYALTEAKFPLLFGMNIGAKNYNDINYQQQIAKLDAVVFGFYKGWNGDRNGEKIREVLKNIKTLNPNILLGQYTLLNETYNNPKDTSTVDKRNKIIKQRWWLRNKNGEMLQWSKNYNAWDINITHWVRPDNAGLRYPEWLAKRDYLIFFKKIPEFDIWYFDNVMWRPRLKQADWTNTGVNLSNDDPVVQQAYREAHVAEWQAAKNLAPGLLQMGNSDNDLSSSEYAGKLQGAFLEALMGEVWSLGTWKGWHGMMEHYHKVMNNTAEPHMVVFNVSGSPTDYQFFRFSFTSSLLNNGYFSFTDKSKGYSSVPWFDEYDIDLGTAIDGPQYTPNSGGIYLRRFQNGMVLVNPAITPKTVVVPPGYSFFNGKQANNINTGKAAGQVRLSGRDGIVLIK